MGGKGPSQSTINAQEQIAGEFANVAQSQEQQSQTLFQDIGLPGLQSAQAYYQKLASGDIQAAVGPAEEQIDAQTAGTVQNIQQTTPRGGVKLLAEDEAKISGAGQKGNLITQAYTSAFPALAQLGTGGTGLSTAAISQAIAGFQGAGTTQSQIGQEESAGKATQLGFFGALAGAGGQAASAFA